jgi:hypothetical protein
MPESGILVAETGGHVMKWVAVLAALLALAGCTNHARYEAAAADTPEQEELDQAQKEKEARAIEKIVLGLPVLFHAFSHVHAAR